MPEGDTIVEQALEVAHLEAAAEVAAAEAELAHAEAMQAAAEAQAHQAPQVSDQVQVAQIEAEKEITIAEIMAEAHQNATCCEHCATKFAELEGRVSMHETAMRLELDALHARLEQAHADVEKIPVRDVKEKPPQAEKKDKKKPVFGKLMLG